MKLVFLFYLKKEKKINYSMKNNKLLSLINNNNGEKRRIQSTNLQGGFVKLTHDDDDNGVKEEDYKNDDDSNGNGNGNGNDNKNINHHHHYHHPHPHHRSDLVYDHKEVLTSFSMLFYEEDQMELRCAIELICTKFERNNRDRQKRHLFNSMSRLQFKKVLVNWLENIDDCELRFYLNFLFNLVGMSYFVAPDEKVVNITDYFQLDFFVCISLATDAARFLVLTWTFIQPKVGQDEIPKFEELQLEELDAIFLAKVCTENIYVEQQVKDIAQDVPYVEEMLNDLAMMQQTIYEECMFLRENKRTEAASASASATAAAVAAAE